MTSSFLVKSGLLTVVAKSAADARELRLKLGETSETPVVVCYMDGSILTPEQLQADNLFGLRSRDVGHE